MSSIGWLAVVGWVGIILFAGLWLWSRRAARAAVEAVGGIGSGSRDLILTEAKALGVALREEQDRAKELEAALQVEQRRAQEFFKTIDSALLERNNWQASYYKESIQHGNAQNLMLGAIERLHLQLTSALGGKAPKLDPIFSQVRDEHKVEHVLPALQGIATIKQQLALETEAQNAVRPKAEVPE